MEPQVLLAWVGVIALCIIITAITLLIVWSVVCTMRGKTGTGSHRTAANTTVELGPSTIGRLKGNGAY